MNEAELTDLVQRCMAFSPTLAWLNNPENTTTVLWIMGIGFLLHASVLLVVLVKAGDLIVWMAGKGWWLIQKGWAWHRQTRVRG